MSAQANPSETRRTNESRVDTRSATSSPGTSSGSIDKGWLAHGARLFATRDDAAPMILRLTLALVIFPHGAQKLLGWFGGFGYAGTMDYLAGTVGLPALIAFLVIVIEFFGPLALVAGFLTRLAALGVGAIMVGAIATQHFANGFFMNWTGAQAGEGFEYHLLVLGIVLVLTIFGGGKLSVDRLLARSGRGNIRPELMA